MWAEIDIIQDLAGLSLLPAIPPFIMNTLEKKAFQGKPQFCLSLSQSVQFVFRLHDYTDYFPRG